MTAGPKFVIRRSRLRRNRFWVAAIAANGETLSHSEQLTSRAAAEANIEAQRLLADAPVEDRTRRPTTGGYVSSGRPATDLEPPPAGPAPGARSEDRT